MTRLSLTAHPSHPSLLRSQAAPGAPTRRLPRPPATELLYAAGQVLLPYLLAAALLLAFAH